MDSRLEKLKESLESSVEGMSSEQLSWHLPGKWCASEVLEHLYLSYTGTIQGFERVIRKGKPLGSPVSMAHRVRTWVVVGLGHMPSGREAPAVARPRGLPVDKVRNEMGETIALMDAIIAQCEGALRTPGARARPSDSRPVDHETVEKAASGAWAASLEADSSASRKCCSRANARSGWSRAGITARLKSGPIPGFQDRTGIAQKAPSLKFSASTPKAWSKRAR